MAVELQHQSEISSKPSSVSFQDLAGALAGRQSIPGLGDLYELIERSKDVAVRKKDSISAAVDAGREAYLRESAKS